MNPLRVTALRLPAVQTVGPRHVGSLARRNRRGHSPFLDLPLLLPSLWRRVTLVYLVLGVPTLLGLALTETLASIPAIIASLSGILVLSSLTGWPWLLGLSLYRRFFGLFLVLFFATAVLGTGNAETTAREQMISLALCFVWGSSFVSAPFLIGNERDLRTASRAIELFGFLLSSSLFLAYITMEYFGIRIGEVLVEDGALRSFGPFGDQVGFVIIYFALFYIARHRPLPALFHVGAVFFTGTRGAYLALLIGVLWLSWLQFSSRAHSRRISSRFARSVAVVVIGAVMFLASPYGATAVDRISSVAWGQGSLGQRAAAMRIGLEIVADHPIAGVGYLGFSRQRELYRFDAVAALGGQDASTFTAQNQFVQTATDAGIPGLVLLALFLWSLHKALRAHANQANTRARVRAEACSSWVVAMAVGNLGAVWLLPTAITLYAFFLICAIELRCLSLMSSDLPPTPAAASR